MTAAISIKQLTKVYKLGAFGQKRVRALTDLSLEIAAGQVYGLLGPNGAGKSTTIKILLNLIRATSGTALLFGLPPSSTEARKLLGFLPENPSPYEYLTGEELVELAAKLSGLTGADVARRTTAVIERVEMGAARKLQIRRYSKGMVQRISLAQALVAEPRLLILDEPTSGLDVLGRQLIRDIILEQRKRGTSIVFCSHIIPDVEALCDRVAVLVGGKLVREGSVEQLLASNTNTFEATAEGVDDA
ncbi:MAG: ABC transporter ATP-binding protein, partial [Myxococcaceae bacterium]|nr:ABC transporter ATP-binding protein [Myxococcaceae bacterium]